MQFAGRKHSTESIYDNCSVANSSFHTIRNAIPLNESKFHPISNYGTYFCHYCWFMNQDLNIWFGSIKSLMSVLICEFCIRITQALDCFTDIDDKWISYAALMPPNEDTKNITTPPLIRHSTSEMSSITFAFQCCKSNEIWNVNRFRFILQSQLTFSQQLDSWTNNWIKTVWSAFNTTTDSFIFTKPSRFWLWMRAK